MKVGPEHETATHRAFDALGPVDLAIPNRDTSA